MGALVQCFQDILRGGQQLQQNSAGQPNWTRIDRLVEALTW
jgi:hypothetical protein